MEEKVFSIGQLLWQMVNLGLLLALAALVTGLLLRGRKGRTEKAEPVPDAALPLGEMIRQHRMRCKMTQEFVAGALDVSRQAVSKWESGASMPSTANLMALANLFQVDAAQMLRAAK